MTHRPPQPPRRYGERAIEVGVTMVGATGLAALLLILLFIGKEALPLFTERAARDEASLARMFLPQPFREGGPTAFVWQPVSRVPKVSMVPLWLGTVKVSVLAMALAFPLGVLAAIFAAELAPRRLREVLKPAVELLAGVPSVVLGFFTMVVIAGGIQEAFDLTYRLNGGVAAAGLSFTLVPVVFTVAEDALAAVPSAHREASLALGATRWETAIRVVLPAAAPGILAAGVLGFGRAVGETMIVLMASGNAPILSLFPGDSVRTLSATIAAELGEVVLGSPHSRLLFFVAVELFLLTFVLNLFVAVWRKRLLRRLSGGEAG